MDNNQINSLVDNSVSNTSGISKDQNSANIQPITPEGIPLNIETPINTEQKPELHPEVEGKIETQNTQSKEEPNAFNTNNNLTEINNHSADQKNPATVDKTTEQYTNKPLETIDRLSILADEDEKDFINNVKAAHEHT